VTRKRMLQVAMIVACAVTSVPALSAQDGEPSYSLDGAWFGWATIEGLQPFPFMDIYSSDSGNPGRSGPVLCTLSTGVIPGPVGPLVSGTQSAHGNWIRVAKNKFAFTAWKILLNEAGQPVGMAKFWGSVTAKASDTFTGTVNAAFYYGQSESAFATFKGTTVSHRIMVELEAQ